MIPWSSRYRRPSAEEQLAADVMVLGLLCRQRADLHAAIFDMVAVILQRDVPLHRLAVVLHLLELAPLHQRGPCVARQFVLDDLLAIEPMLDVIAVGHDLALVPCARRLGQIFLRRVQGVI